MINQTTSLMEDEAKHVAYLQPLIVELENAVHEFITKIGPPVFINEPGKQRFRFKEPSSLHFQIIKAIRVVSSLYASVSLLQDGHIQDVGNVFRTIHECLTEIDFVQEAHTTGSPTPRQQEIIDLFFARELMDAQEMVNNPPKFRKVPRKHIRASAARVGQQFIDQDKMRKINEAFDNMWSGYTHAEYLETMELFEIDNGAMTCRMRDMSDTPKIATLRFYLASFIMNALNRFSVIANNLGLKDLERNMLEKRRGLEHSEAYTSTPPLAAT